MLIDVSRSVATLCLRRVDESILFRNEGIPRKDFSEEVPNLFPFVWISYFEYLQYFIFKSNIFVEY